MNPEFLQPAAEEKLPTRGETSLAFYLAIATALFFLPGGIAIAMGTLPRGSIPVGIALAIIGLLALLAGIRMASLKVWMTSKGLVFRRLWDRTEIAWQDVESIRFATLHEKHGDYGNLIVVESPRQTFHFILRSSAFGTIHQRLLSRCTNAVIMEDDLGIVRPPMAGDSDSRRIRTRKYARRMVKRRAISSGIGILVVLLVGARLLARGQSAGSMGTIAVVCLAIIGALAADVYRLAKRLWN